MRAGGATTLLSGSAVGPQDCCIPMDFLTNSADGQHVFFRTRERLVQPDLDARVDIYEWSAGTLSVVVAGPTGGNGSFDQFSNVMVSQDGSRVFFDDPGATWSPRIPTATQDAYERSGGITRLLSTGPVGGNGALDVRLEAVSEDGARAFFRTAEPLTADDPNTSEDTYRSEGGAITRVSQGAFTQFAGISPDGGHFFFRTREGLVPADDDQGTCPHPLGCMDIYEYHPAGPVFVSAAADGSGGVGADVVFRAVSDDGQRVFFDTKKQLSPDDTDAETDIYEHSAGTTQLISTSGTAGNASAPAVFNDVTADGARVFFWTTDALVPADTNGVADTYERSARHDDACKRGSQWQRRRLPRTFRRTGPGSSSTARIASCRRTPTSSSDYYERLGSKTYLITDFTPSWPGYTRFTPDLQHLFLLTDDSLLPQDTDAYQDLYVVSAGPVVGHARPKGASPVWATLVPAYAQCAAPDATHGAPLAFPSCRPPAMASANLTFGTPDANGAGARSVGAVSLVAKPGNEATDADEADVRIGLTLTDVRWAGTLADYAGELEGEVTIRLTDNGRFAPITNPPQTVQDLPLRFPASARPPLAPRAEAAPQLPRPTRWWAAWSARATARYGSWDPSRSATAALTATSTRLTTRCSRVRASSFRERPYSGWRTTGRFVAATSSSRRTGVV